MSQYDNNSDEFITIGGKRYILAYHVKRRMEQRNIEVNWVYSILTNWVARKFNVKNDSMNYYGFVPGRKYLIMVAVSETNETIPTIFPDSDATESYSQGDYSYFDEVR